MPDASQQKVLPDSFKSIPTFGKSERHEVDPCLTLFLL